MSQIRVSNLSFYYEGSYEEIFKDVSFSIDTSWKLGFIGRNGRGKTTFLNLLMGKYEYTGSIHSPEQFDYFPFTVEDMTRDTVDVAEEIDPQMELWRLMREMSLLEMDPEVLYRPFETLSSGERTKVMLAILFLRENHFLLIDEPTNHLDAAARQAVCRYLNRKSGFILVSHDRTFLDGCIDHVLALNKQSIEVVQGNFTSWWENKQRKDEFEVQENEKLKKEIGRLKDAAKRNAEWSEQVESTKNSTRVAGLRPDRGHIGHMAAKMMKRSKTTENRIERAAQEKEKLLKDVETAETLRILPLTHHKEVLVHFDDVSLGYEREDELGYKRVYEQGTQQKHRRKTVCRHLSFELRQGDRLAIDGGNGCGKSTVLKALLGAADVTPDREKEAAPVLSEGRIETAPGLVISYVSQDTSWLRGDLESFTEYYGLDGTLFRAILRKLDFSREHFNKEMQFYSEGQKKKVLLAKSLCERAHLYIWDEPLNFIDIFSRMQIERLIRTQRLTMIFVEHDQTFKDEIATGRVELHNMD